MTARDLDLLQATGRLRFAMTRQLARLAFDGSQWAARKRLRRLLDAGLLRCWVPRLDGPNVYALTPHGARVLGESAPDQHAWPTPRGLDRRLNHVLAVNSVRIALATTLPDEGGELLWWRCDDELAGVVRAPVIPDGLFEVRWPEKRQVFVLEVDRTPPAPRAFVRKLLQYQALPGGTYGRAGFAILVVAGQPLWAERTQQRAHTLRLRLPIWFASFATVEADGARAGWRSATGEIKPSLRTVASAGKGTAVEEPAGAGR